MLPALRTGPLKAPDPCLQGTGIRTLKQFCIDYGSSFDIGLELLGCPADPASAGCGKSSHLLAGKVMGLAEVVHDAGGSAVPDREADQDRVIAFKVFDITRERDLLFAEFLPVAAGKRIDIVEVGCRIGLLRTDLEKVRSNS